MPSTQRNKGLLIDSNLLLLKFLGQVDLQIIPRFKRTQRFSFEDFGLLEAYSQSFEVLVTTPNILTEVSNLSNQLPYEWKLAVLENLGRQVRLLSEEHVPSTKAAKNDDFSKYGLTDTVILLLAKEKYQVLTVDLPLYN